VQVRFLAATAVAALLFASAASAAEPAAATPENGIFVYDQAFFASARPNTAYDMVKRVPGFTLTPAPRRAASRERRATC